MRASRSRSTHWLKAPALPAARKTASERTTTRHNSGIGPCATATPPAALSMMATAIRGLKTIITSVIVVLLPIAVAVIVIVELPGSLSPAPVSAALSQHPQFRQILPVDEVVEDEGGEEDGHQDVGARQMEGAGTAVGRNRVTHLLLRHRPERGNDIAGVDLLAEQYAGNHDDHDTAHRQTPPGSPTVRSVPASGRRLAGSRN